MPEAYPIAVNPKIAEDVLDVITAWRDGSMNLRCGKRFPSKENGRFLRGNLNAN